MSSQVFRGWVCEDCVGQSASCSGDDSIPLPPEVDRCIICGSITRELSWAEGVMKYYDGSPSDVWKEKAE